MIRFGYRTPGLRELSFRQKAQLAVDLGLPVIEAARTEFETLDDCRDLWDACAELGVGGHVPRPSRHHGAQPAPQTGKPVQRGLRQLGPASRCTEGR